MWGNLGPISSSFRGTGMEQGCLCSSIQRNRNSHLLGAGHANETGRTGTIDHGTIQRKVESACPGETNLTTTWRLASFYPLVEVQIISFSATYMREIQDRRKCMCPRSLGRNELEWFSYGEIYQLLSCDSGTEIWMGQKFSRALDHL